MASSRWRCLLPRWAASALLRRSGTMPVWYAWRFCQMTAARKLSESAMSLTTCETWSTAALNVDANSAAACSAAARAVRNSSTSGAALDEESKVSGATPFLSRCKNFSRVTRASPSLASNSLRTANEASRRERALRSRASSRRSAASRHSADPSLSGSAAGKPAPRKPTQRQSAQRGSGVGARCPASAAEPFSGFMSGSTSRLSAP